MRETSTVETITVQVHGRFLVSAPSTAGPWPTLVGFHGYMEDAERHLARLQRLPDAAGWLLVSVQGLYRFYHPKYQTVVASWMTKQDRELAIADNLAYVQAVVDAVEAQYETIGPLVYTGFSQGVAMAYRAATRGGHPCQGVVALGGDVPPELREDSSLMWPAVLVGRGRTDEWYAQATMDADLAFLGTTGSRVESLVFDGAHEWTDEFAAAAGRFLASVR